MPPSFTGFSFWPVSIRAQGGAAHRSRIGNRHGSSRSEQGAWRGSSFRAFFLERVAAKGWGTCRAHVCCWYQAIILDPPGVQRAVDSSCVVLHAHHVSACSTVL